MGVCSLCGRDAGWFRESHQECVDKRDAGWSLMVATARNAYLNGDTQSTHAKLSEVAHSSYQQSDSPKRALLQGWQEAVDRFLDNQMLSEDEERRLLATAEQLGIAGDELRATEGWSRVVKAAVLRDVLAGKIESRITVNSALPFNLQKRETLVWLFQNVRYGESRTRTRYVGGSQGVSVRVMRGVYYRVGAFQGERVQSTELVFVDTGLLGVTDNHLYFVGPAKGLRIPYRKVASFTPYSDGLGVHRDTMTAKQQVFVTEDAWFTYNLVTNLARLASE